MWKRARRRLGSKIIVLEVNTGRDLERLLAMAVQRGVRALLVGNDPFINSQAQQLITLAARYEVPAMYGLRKYRRPDQLQHQSTRIRASGRHLRWTYPQRRETL